MKDDSTIQSVTAWEALDSRGRPTVACRVTVAGGEHGSALVPSGASAGSHEALERRDGGARYGGRGVRDAVGAIVDTLAPLVVGRDATDQRGIDSLLAAADPSPGYSALGANALLAVSLGVLRAAAAARRVSLAAHLAGHGPLLLPMPRVNIVSGGAHAGGLIDVQDFLIVPVGASNFAQAIEWSASVRESAREVALDQGFPEAVLVADEGGLGLPLASNRDALTLLVRAIERSGFVPGDDVAIALDVAASELVDTSNGRTGYLFASEGRSLSAAELIDELAEWCDEYPIVSIEDPLGEDDWDAWATVNARLGGRIELIGDDLFVTNAARLDRGIAQSSANAVLVKVNQNGLVSGAHDVLRAAQDAGYSTIVSARSGETEDDWLADLAVGWSAGQIKVGSTHRSDRTAKWNRLLELEATEETTFARPDFPPRAADSTTTERTAQ